MRKYLSVFFIFLTFQAVCQNGVIKGVITFRDFNNAYATIFKPDVGSNITALPEEKGRLFYSEINKCENGLNFYEKELALAETDTKKLEMAYNELSPFASSKKFKRYKDMVDSAKKVTEQKRIPVLSANKCKREAFNYYISQSEDFEKTVIDGGGNYSLKLSQGVYIVFLFSNNTGLKAVKQVNIITDKEVNFSHQFYNGREINFLN